MRAWGIIVAAGSGERLGADEPKAFVPLAGVPMVAHSLRAFRASARVEGVVVVTPPGYEDRLTSLADAVAPGLRVYAIAGGATRSASVREGLRVVEAAGEGVETVVIHDAARPLVRGDDIDRALAALADASASVCAAPAGDTLKRVSADGVVSESVPRDGLYRAFTPQAFRTDVLRAAHEGEPEATDDATLVEASGSRVVIVETSGPALKITAPDDLALAARLLGATRTGIGFDSHGFASAARPLILGGVEIVGARGLAGHSDADVLTHAVVDAILGAAGLGDIGMHFPSSDPRWADADSLMFAREATAMAHVAGWTVGTIDATLILEAPSIGRYRDAMRAALAHALGVPTEAISVKATTTDGMGFIGRGEGAGALAIASLYTRSY